MTCDGWIAGRTVSTFKIEVRTVAKFKFSLFENVFLSYNPRQFGASLTVVVKFFYFRQVKSRKTPRKGLQ